MTPVALTIAGSDPSGGAGIQADLKTFTALRVYGASVIVALTAQNTLGVTGIHAVPPEFISAQMDAVLSDIRVTAGKIGMLGTSAAVQAVGDALGRHDPFPLVVDPVMVATSGDPLLEPDAEEALKTLILPRAALLTPNMFEAARLLGTDPAEDERSLRRQASAILGLGPSAVLLKGGHAQGDEAVDIFCDRESTVALRAGRIETPNTHGTGCTLSAAIAANLAQGHPLNDAVREAKGFVTEAIRGGVNLGIGAGRGPLDHAGAAQDV